MSRRLFAVSQLREGHRQILIPTREASRTRISALSSHATAKLAIGQKAQQLREDGSALIHAPLSARPRFILSEVNRFSNRGNQNPRSTLSNKSTCQRRGLH